MLRLVHFSDWRRRISPVLLSLAVLAVMALTQTSQALAANYYIDSSGGSDTNPGTSEGQPWKELSKLHAFNFQPGDVIHFKRGSSWTGPLVINDSGTEAAPVRYTAYGSGDKPIITGLTNNQYKRAIEILASWIVVEDFQVRDAADAGIEIFEGHPDQQRTYDHNVIRRVDFRNIGIGVTIKSNYNRVESSTFDNFMMVRKTETPTDDDYGAIAINFNADAARTRMQRDNITGNIVTRNTVKNATAESPDYGFDGGFVEIFDDVDNTTISYNWVETSKGFIEIGGNDHLAVMENLKIHHNISLNNQLFSFVNVGTYGILVKNFEVYNNLLYEADGQPKTAFWFDGPASIGPEEFKVKNNIMYLRATVSNKNTFEHTHNLYYRLDRAADQSDVDQSEIGYVPHATEKIAGAQFQNVANRDFTVQNTSPVINAGVDLGLGADYSQVVIPQGGIPDIGPFESVVTSTPTPSPGVCTADINEDGRVNLADVTILVTNLAKDNFSPPRVDLIPDGKINLKDYTMLISQLGDEC